MSLSRFLLSCSLLVSLSLVGCSSGDPNRKPTKPIAVTVTYNGAAVPGATVSFINESEPAYGLTDAQGVAKMKTYEEADGVVMGKHRVTISKSETTGDGAADQDSPAYVPPELSTAPPPTVKHHVPEKYSAPHTSELTAEVSESSPSEIKFDLTD